MTPEEIQALIDKSVTSAVGKVVGESLKPLAEQVKTFSDGFKSLQENQKILGDAIAAFPNPKSDDKGGKGDKGKDAGTAQDLTLESLTKILDERDAKRQTSEKVLAARQKVIGSKLKDVPSEFLGDAPDTDDETKLNEWADAKIKRVNEVLKPAVGTIGGAGRDGGNKPGDVTDPSKGPDLTKGGALTQNQGKFAASIAKELEALKA